MAAPASSIGNDNTVPAEQLERTKPGSPGTSRDNILKIPEFRPVNCEINRVPVLQHEIKTVAINAKSYLDAATEAQKAWFLKIFESKIMPAVKKWQSVWKDVSPIDLSQLKPEDLEGSSTRDGLINRFEFRVAGGNGAYRVSVSDIPKDFEKSDGRGNKFHFERSTAVTQVVQEGFETIVMPHKVKPKEHAISELEKDTLQKYSLISGETSVDKVCTVKLKALNGAPISQVRIGQNMELLAWDVYTRLSATFHKGKMHAYYFGQVPKLVKPETASTGSSKLNNSL